MAAPLHHIASRPGAYETLRALEGSSITAYTTAEVHRLMLQCGISDPTRIVTDFLGANLLCRYGERLGLTTLGIRTCLLIEAINGADLRHVFRQLSHLDSTLNTYELVEQGMTGVFLRNLNDRPGFGRLYFCSPWISLDRKHRDMLTNAVFRADAPGRTRPELYVLARPEPGRGFSTPTSLRMFQDLGSTVFLNKSLHTKLYIREPDLSGGYAMAILGSQNLTKSNYIELGIRINADSQVINQLIAYFWRLTNHSHEV